MQFIVEGEMLASKVNEGLNSLVVAHRTADTATRAKFEAALTDYFDTAGFGSSLGHYVEKVHAQWPSPESAKMRFPGPGCLHLTPTKMQSQEIEQFLSKIGELTLDPDGYLTGIFIYWSWAQYDWLLPKGNFANTVEVSGLDPVTMPYDWCIIFCGSSLSLHLWGSKTT